MWNCPAASGFKPGVQYPLGRLNEDLSVTATKRQQSVFLIGDCTDIRLLFENGIKVCHKKIKIQKYNITSKHELVQISQSSEEVNRIMIDFFSLGTSSL